MAPAPLNVLDLFSGIGGFALGFERAGLRTVAFCEIEPYCRAVLARHWPRVPCYHDVRKLTASRLVRDGIERVDVVAGGFPCQDVSVAGEGAGLAGEDSGLWFEQRRIVSEVRPRFVVVENVAALLSRGLGTILGDLASLGYAAEWHCIPAASVGAPHRRDRVFVIADADGHDVRNDEQRTARGRDDLRDSRDAVARDCGAAEFVADADGGRCEVERIEEHAGEQRERRDESDGCSSRGRRSRPIDSDAERERSHRPRDASDPGERRPESDLRRVVDGIPEGMDERSAWSDGEWPDVPRVTTRSPHRTDRLRALGNAVVPQITEIIGREILKRCR